MEGWTLATSATPTALAQALRDALAKHGQRVVEKSGRGTSEANVYRTSEGAHVIVEGVRPNLAISS